MVAVSMARMNPRIAIVLLGAWSVLFVLFILTMEWEYRRARRDETGTPWDRRRSLMVRAGLVLMLAVAIASFTIAASL